jgi:hypothetical protein
MKQKFPATLIVALVLIIGLLAYLLGRKSGDTTIENIATNSAFVREIANLSTLEVQGSSSLKRSNVVNDGTFSDQMRRLFLENTVNVSIPYIAQYGVNLGLQNIAIEKEKKTVTVHLPKPELLSYELRIDKLDASNRKGWLIFSNDDTYTEVERKLYVESRKQMESNTVYLERSKNKITQVITDYYAPLAYTVNVQFDR